MSTERQPKGKPSGSTDEPPWRDEEELRRLYIEEGLSTREIADRFGCHHSTVNKYRRRFGIEPHSRGYKTAPPHEHGDSRDGGSKIAPYARYTVNPDGYPKWEQSGAADRRFTKRSFSVHRLVAVAEFGFDAVAGNIVHHKNGIPWDNRPANLAVMSRSEHGKLHHERGDVQPPANAGETRVSSEELLLDLRAGRAYLGYRPRSTDYQAFSPHGLLTLQNRFGSFRKALEAAGIDPDTGEMQPMEEWGEKSEYVDL